MQRNILWLAYTLIWCGCLQIAARTKLQDSTYKKHFVGSTFLMLGNLDKVNNPEFIQVNLGFRLNPKNVISFEFKRSIYSWPLGIPWGPSFDAPGLNYPGHARILAPTVAYQHFWWRGIYTSLHALNAFEKYLDPQNKKIGNGYTLYLTSRLGYQIRFLKNRFFFEPSLGITFWPVRTNLPDSFKSAENKWPNYFGWEPGLHFGYNFDIKKQSKPANAHP